MQLKDLIYLSYASPNTCYTTVSDRLPLGVMVDVRAGKWSFEGKAYKINTETRNCNWGSQHGMIGVYDRSEVRNLERMVRDSQAALRSPSKVFDD
jgi:hypothetical protein